jgi:hypothetical protein
MMRLGCGKKNQIGSQKTIILAAKQKDGHSSSSFGGWTFCFQIELLMYVMSKGKGKGKGKAVPLQFDMFHTVVLVHKYYLIVRLAQ